MDKIALDDLAQPGTFVVTLPGYPSMSVKGDTALKALIDGISKLMQASSNKKIVYNDEWYGEPQFGTLVNRLRPTLDRYVLSAPGSATPEVKAPVDNTEVPPSPGMQAEEYGEETSRIFEDSNMEHVHQEIADEVADRLVQVLTGDDEKELEAKPKLTEGRLKALIDGPVSLNDIVDGVGGEMKEAAAKIDKLMESGEVVMCVSGCYAPASMLVEGSKVLLPTGAEGTVDAVEGKKAFVSPDLFDGNAGKTASFSAVKWPFSALRLILAPGIVAQGMASYEVRVPGQRTVSAKAPTKLAALRVAVASFMESSNNRVMYHERWYTTADRLVEKLRPGLDRYVGRPIRTK